MELDQVEYHFGLARLRGVRLPCRRVHGPALAIFASRATFVLLLLLQTTTFF
jgi:hypothetical protein